MIRRLKASFRNYAVWHDFNLACFKRRHTNQYNTPGTHLHKDFYELVIVAEGSANHSTGGHEWFIQAGNVFLIPPNQRHCYTEYKNLLIYNLLFSERFIFQLLPDLETLPGMLLLFNRQDSPTQSCNLTIEINAFREILVLLDEFHNLREAPKMGGKTLSISIFTRIMYLLAYHVTPGEQKKDNHLKSISKLLSELQKDITQPWSLEKMASYCSMSVSSFRQKFTAFTGISPINFLLKLRLEKALVMLEVSHEPLDEIAFSCGFSDVNYFSRQFKKTYNMQPSRYRKSYRTGESVLPVDKP